MKKVDKKRCKHCVCREVTRGDALLLLRDATTAANSGGQDSISGGTMKFDIHAPFDAPLRAQERREQVERERQEKAWRKFTKTKAWRDFVREVYRRSLGKLDAP